MHEQLKQSIQFTHAGAVLPAPTCSAQLRYAPKVTSASPSACGPQAEDGAQRLVHAGHRRGADLAEEFPAVEAGDPELLMLTATAVHASGPPITTDMAVSGY
ncbi:hypothetical protein [Streptomyces phaeoluteigriseus]